MEWNGCLQSGHSALFLDHSWMQRKQNWCRQRSSDATLLNPSRQMGHLESGDALANKRWEDLATLSLFLTRNFILEGAIIYDTHKTSRMNIDT